MEVSDSCVSCRPIVAVTRVAEGGIGARLPGGRFLFVLKGRFIQYRGMSEMFIPYRCMSSKSFLSLMFMLEDSFMFFFS